MISKYRIFS